jgi:hypothetical protein
MVPQGAVASTVLTLNLYSSIHLLSEIGSLCCLIGRGLSRVPPTTHPKREYESISPAVHLRLRSAGGLPGMHATVLWLLHRESSFLVHALRDAALSAGRTTNCE